MQGRPALLAADANPAFSAQAYAGYAYPRARDPELAALLRTAGAGGPAAPARYALPFAQARQALLDERRREQTGQPAMQAQRVQPLQAGPRTVALHWYWPQAARDGGLIVYLHGGGWCVGSSATHDTLLRHLADAAALPVCSVDYALAPEHPFPAALQDVAQVVDLLRASHPDAAGRRLVLAGDSAGANLALVEAMRRRDTGCGADLAGLLLFYGVYGPLRAGGSCAAYGQGEFGLSCAAQQRYVDAYLQGATPDDPRVHPLAGRLGGLPPAWLLAAGLDLLLDDSVDLHHAIGAAGGASQLWVAPGVHHGFLNQAHVLGAARNALGAAGHWACRVACAGSMP